MAAAKKNAIRARAYALWEQGGRVEGEHDRHWYQAEREYEASRGQSTASDRARRTKATDPVSAGCVDPGKAKLGKTRDRVVRSPKTSAGVRKRGGSPSSSREVRGEQSLSERSATAPAGK